VLVLMYVLLQRTPIGLAMRAAAHQPEASRLLGIRVSWMLALGWGLASAVGAVSGIMAAPALLLEPNMMQTVIIYAFAAAVLGGIESPLGAVIGGLIVGVAVTLAGTSLPGVGGDLQLPGASVLHRDPCPPLPHRLPGHDSHRRPADGSGRVLPRHPRAAALPSLSRPRDVRAGGGDPQPDQATGRPHRRSAGDLAPAAGPSAAG